MTVLVESVVRKLALGLACSRYFSFSFQKHSTGLLICQYLCGRPKYLSWITGGIEVKITEATLNFCGLRVKKILYFFDVRKSVHYHRIQINQPTRFNSFTSLLLDIYAWLNLFRAPLRSSSGAYNCTRSLWFYCWSVAVGALLVVVVTTTNNAPTATLQR